MIYTFEVDGDIITCTNSKKTIVSDSINHHIAKFIFNDTTWDGYTITPIFRNTKSADDATESLIEINPNEYYIPFKPLEYISTNNELDVGLIGTKTIIVDGKEIISKITTIMPNRLKILQSSGDNYTTPSNPTQSVYDQILAVAQDKYVDSIYVDPKIIYTTDWITATDTVAITPSFSPIIVTSSITTMRTGTFDDFLNTTSYPHTDFYLDYSTDGINTTRIVASGQTVATPSQRKIQFTIGLNVYEVRITSTTITIKLSSGTPIYYIHELLLRFDDYFYYDYQVNGLTEYYKSEIFIYTESKDFLQGISFSRNPTFTGDKIRLNFSQKPQGNIITRFFAFKTDELIGISRILNTEGTVIFSNLNEEPIDDNVSTNDNDIPTVLDVKTYTQNEVVLILQQYGLIP